ncbi:hypothetical protein ACIF8T_20495 [Streptomyces sp. NPDC085946]|uniref:hypothetical protein n=1 Tax=Streptomyces sp. NPDC085946 TaxID=3365744 RepID=UPI0037CD562B
MGSAEHVCPDCGQPVETVVRRHKTLGAWVPVWVAGPCRNPRCAAYQDQQAEAVESGRHGGTRGGQGTGGTTQAPGTHRPEEAARVTEEAGGPAQNRP